MTPSQQLEQDTDFVIQRADIAALRALALAAALRNPPAPNTVQLEIA